MKNVFATSLFLFLGLSCFSQQASSFIYRDRTAPVEDRIEDLIRRMTLEEKVLQMNQWTYGKNANPNNIESMYREVRPEIGSLIYRSVNPQYRNEIQKKAMEESRLGIPILFGFDVIHGYRTVFPIPLAQACSWNIESVKQSCAISAREASLSGVDWTFSPMVDVARDPRWGRVSEGYGEDPYANAMFAVAAIQGYQGDTLTGQYSIAACLKHYVGYGLSEGGRDYHYSDVSAQTLWESFMPPFKAGIEAGAATVMSAFNDITGVPASANHYTLTEILKDRWQHDGFVVSDWGSVENLIFQGVAADRREAGLKSFMAGVEMDMVDNIYVEHLPELVADGTVPMSAIDEAVRRILRIKFRLGLFDEPYLKELPESERYLQPDALSLAESVAAETMVLLKNDNRVLPLDSRYQHIAAIGPMVQDSVHIMGFWEGMGRPQDVTSIQQGLEKEFEGKARLHVAAGSDFDGSDTTGFEMARAAARQSEVIVVFLGEKRRWSGENGSRSTIALPAIQERLVVELQKLGKPMVLVLSSGRPLELIRLNPLADALLEIWQPGTMGGAAVAGILSGRFNPSGKLSITFPQTTGQIPIYYDMRQSARPQLGHYQDIPRDPLYWFGHGLSYTDFTYGEIKLSAAQISKTESIIATVEVTNSGQMDGQEAVLWMIADPVATISRPMKELKYFEKKPIKAGDTVTYSFIIDPIRDLSYVDGEGHSHLEAGQFFLIVHDQKVAFEVVE